jgi:adenine phosphoribosyltransferase
MHIDGVREGQRVLVVDDLLATGGTVGACCQLLEKSGAYVVGCTFLIELLALEGAERIGRDRVFSLLQY